MMIIKLSLNSCYLLLLTILCAVLAADPPKLDVEKPKIPVVVIKGQEEGGTNFTLVDGNAPDNEDIEVIDGKVSITNNEETSHGSDENGTKRKKNQEDEKENEMNETDKGQDKKGDNGRRKNEEVDKKEEATRKKDAEENGNNGKQRRRKEDDESDEQAQGKKDEKKPRKKSKDGLDADLDKETKDNSCIFDNGIIMESGVARNATKSELAKMRKYLKSVENYQANVGKQGANFIRTMAHEMMAPIMSIKSLAKMIVPKDSFEEPKMPDMKPPCFCKRNCDNLVILNTAKD